MRILIRMSYYYQDLELHRGGGLLREEAVHERHDVVELLVRDLQQERVEDTVNFYAVHKYVCAD